MQSAFGLAEILPPARPRIIPGRYRRRAVGAANAGIMAIVQRIVRHVMESNVRPDIVDAPLRQWIELDQPEFMIPLDQSGIRPGRSLIAPNSRDPG